jgi:hypothetical protein
MVNSAGRRHEQSQDEQLGWRRKPHARRGLLEASWRGANLGKSHDARLDPFRPQHTAGHRRGAVQAALHIIRPYAPAVHPIAPPCTEPAAPAN